MANAQRPKLPVGLQGRVSEGKIMGKRCRMCGQLVPILQGIISGILAVNLLAPPSLESPCLLSGGDIWWGLSSCKTSQGNLSQEFI